MLSNNYLSAVSCSSFLMNCTSSFFSSCISFLLWLVSPVQDSFSLIVSVPAWLHSRQFQTWATFRWARFHPPDLILHLAGHKSFFFFFCIMLRCARLDHADGLLLMGWSSDVDLLLGVVFPLGFLALTDVWLWFWSWLEHEERLLPACCDWPPLWEAQCSETVLWKLYWYFIHHKVNSLLYHEVTAFRENILDVFSED